MVDAVPDEIAVLIVVGDAMKMLVVPAPIDVLMETLIAVVNEAEVEPMLGDTPMATIVIAVRFT